MSKLDDIEALLAGSTPGPWGVEHRDFDETWTQDSVDRVTISVDARGFTTEQIGPISAANARFIAACPDSIRYLLRVARAAEVVTRGDHATYVAIVDALDNLQAALEDR